MDQTLDLNGQQTHRILQAFAAPDYIRQASLGELADTDGEPAHMFADPLTRSFLCKNAASTWLSSAFFFEQVGELQPARAAQIRERLLKSAEYFGIGHDVTVLEKQVKLSQQTDLSQLPDDVFALIVKFPDGRVERHYPLRNVAELKKAAEYLNTYRDDFRFSDRHNIAKRILEKTAEIGASLPEHQDMLDRIAGNGICGADDAFAMIRSRVSHIPDRRIKEELTKLADIVRAKGMMLHTTSAAIGVAEAIDQIDKANHLQYSDGGIERPEDVLFAVTEKIASQATSEMTGNPLSGLYYHTGDLSKIDTEDLRDAFGDDFVNSVTTGNTWLDVEKLAMALPKMAGSEAQLFDDIAKASSVFPIATTVIGKQVACSR